MSLNKLVKSRTIIKKAKKPSFKLTEKYVLDNREEIKKFFKDFLEIQEYSFGNRRIIPYEVEEYCIPALQSFLLSKGLKVDKKELIPGTDKSLEDFKYKEILFDAKTNYKTATGGKDIVSMKTLLSNLRAKLFYIFIKYDDTGNKVEILSVSIRHLSEMPWDVMYYNNGGLQATNKHIQTPIKKRKEIEIVKILLKKRQEKNIEKIELLKLQVELDNFYVMEMEESETFHYEPYINMKDDDIKVLKLLKTKINGKKFIKKKRKKRRTREEIEEAERKKAEKKKLGKRKKGSLKQFLLKKGKKK